MDVKKGKVNKSSSLKSGLKSGTSNLEQLLNSSKASKSKIIAKRSYMLYAVVIFIVIIIVVALNKANISIFSLISRNKQAPSNVYTQSIKTIEIESEESYAESTPGSWHINKSAEWTGVKTAKITFDVDTVIKEVENQKYKDVILVVDISGSMYGDKLDKVKSDAVDLSETLLANHNNNVALITYGSDSQIISNFTNDSDFMTEKINALSVSGCTNYNAGFKNVDVVMQSYTKQPDREVIMMFLTDGYPNEDIPNQVATYKILKDKYPYMEINGIQYEMGTAIKQDIIDISDKQWVADMETLNNVLFDAIPAITPLVYEKYEVVDYIDSKFIVDSEDDITVTKGSVKLEEENGLQKITWTLDGTMTGFNAHMYINVSLKDEFVQTQGFYPTNEEEKITYKVEDDEEKIVTSSSTPVLERKKYTVTYESNLPEGQTSEVVQVESYVPHTIVTKKQDAISYEGYNFLGWEIVDSGVSKKTDNTFVMPAKNVTIRATWGKPGISKSMDGTVKIVKHATFDTGSNVNAKMKQLSGQSGATISASNTTITSIKRASAIAEEYKTSNNIVSTSTSEVPIYMWYDNGTIYWHSEAEKPYLSSDSIYMFYNCRGLISLDVSNWDTSNVTSMYNMFANCSSLTSLDVSNFDTSNVTDMYEMFAECSSLTSLDISHFDTCNVTNMFYMFAGCKGLANLDVSHFDTSNVMDMRGMFVHCSSLTSLDVSNFNTSKVSEMSHMFGYCSSLTSLDVSNFDTSNVINMLGMFFNCNNLTSLDLSNFNTSKVTDMSYMFGLCDNLRTIYVRNNLSTSGVTNSIAMFSNCTKLVGGRGTTYHSAYTDKTYARIDGGTSRPGYFTRK